MQNYSLSSLTIFRVHSFVDRINKKGQNYSLKLFALFSFPISFQHYRLRVLSCDITFSKRYRLQTGVLKRYLQNDVTTHNYRLHLAHFDSDYRLLLSQNLHFLVFFRCVCRLLIKKRFRKWRHQTLIPHEDHKHLY